MRLVAWWCGSWGEWGLLVWGASKGAEDGMSMGEVKMLAWNGEEEDYGSGGGSRKRAR